MVPMQVLKFYVMSRAMPKLSGKDPHASRNRKFVIWQGSQFFMKYILNPTLVGLILYGRETLGGEYGVRVCLAFSLINTSYLFLGSIGSIPIIGSYTNMISKVSNF